LPSRHHPMLPPSDLGNGAVQIASPQKPVHNTGKCGLAEVSPPRKGRSGLGAGGAL
jgi:hypothetical protein